MILSGWKLISAYNRLTKQSAAVLITVLAVMVVLLLLFLAAFTFIASRYSYHVKQQNRLIAKNLAQAGLTRGIDRLYKMGLAFDSVSVESPNGGQISAKLSAWGPYVLVTSRGMFANQEVTCQSLIGMRPNEFFDAAITVADESMPLVASGDTRIFGDVNTGHQGLTTGRMRGESITNEDFHKGKVNLHQSILVPALDSNVLNKYLNEVSRRKRQCEMMVEGSSILTNADVDLLKTNNCISVENNLRIQAITISNFENISSIFVNGFVEIVGNCRISGLIEIVSTGPIFVLDSSILDDVILMTPDSIVLGDYTVFSGTAISSRQITVQDKAQLHYPSFLLIRDEKELDDFHTGIYLKSKSKMESTCYAEQKLKPKDRNSPVIYLDSTSTFTGIIVAQSKADIRGIVNGSILTERFHYLSPPTTYVNWIKDLQVYRANLDYRPVLPFLESPHDSQSIAILRSDFLQ